MLNFNTNYFLVKSFIKNFYLCIQKVFIILKTQTFDILYCSQLTKYNFNKSKYCFDKIIFSGLP